MIYDRKIRDVLMRVKHQDLNPERAIKEIYVIFGELNNASCYLDRKPEDCCIFKHGSKLGCNACGHYSEK